MNTTAAVLAGAIGIIVAIAVSWFISKQLQEEALDAAAANIEKYMTVMRNHYLVGIATELAAPHLSPDPRHTEENRLILDHWVNFTRQMFQNGTLPS